ncbi:hypothetical protein [Streptomyces fructofermentans]|nr:hypothetical protein [Streptomyces fructofermentans]
MLKACSQLMPEERYVVTEGSTLVPTFRVKVLGWRTVNPLG